MSPFPSADSEGRAYRNVSPGLRFFLTAALSVTLMYLDHRGTYLEQVRAWLGAALYPVQIAIDSPVSGARWLQENLALRARLIAENATLRQESLIARAELQRLAALRAENGRFRALLDSRSRIPDRVVISEILAVDMDPLRHRVILNKGGRDGAYVGQAMLDAGGVVGQITRDQSDSSEALLITDPDHAVPVEIVRNGLRTIAMGTGDLERLSLPFLTRNADIRTGDLLVTSGLGGAFPAGYPVGTVTKVDASAGDAFLEVAARPAASLDRLHEVLLVFEAKGAAADASRAPAAAAAKAAPGVPPPTPAAPPVTPALVPEATSAPAQEILKPGPPAATPPAELTPATAGPPSGTLPSAAGTPAVVDAVPGGETAPGEAAPPPSVETALPPATGPAMGSPAPAPETPEQEGAEE